MGGRGSAGTSVTQREIQAENQVRAAYRAVAEEGEWVRLSTLRDRLGSMSRQEQDAALKRLDRKPGAILAPENDQTSLSAKDRAAAITLGGQPQHMIKITDASPKPVRK